MMLLCRNGYCSCSSASQCRDDKCISYIVLYSASHRCLYV